MDSLNRTSVVFGNEGGERYKSKKRDGMILLIVFLISLLVIFFLSSMLFLQVI